jgi:hypothetical protein
VNAPNRLANARSPYLLQHAHNPVDWYEWSDEAFEKARHEDKPVFLSVGYSACHWCHVMERESFEDSATAKLLNERFVSIKVDREERPDVDQVYQLAHQVLTQRAGGWPLSMFLTAEKKPFFGGTYFPNTRKYGMPSFQDVLLAVHDAWVHKRADVDTQAGELTRMVGQVTSLAAAQAGPVEPAVLEDAVRAALRRAERTHGGFGHAPKFPNTMTLDLLFIAAATRNDAEARAHALLTLDRMAKGGIYDHLGGGFARYSTDERWLIPHFEKMLYDNAQLARLYLDGWRLLSDGGPGEIPRARCEQVVRETLAYVLREMTDPSGVFYSAQDADSEGEEGRFFVWTPAEIEAVLSKPDAEVVCAYFDVTPEGNFEHGRSALWTPRTPAQVASQLGRTPKEVEEALARAKPLLFAAREKRVHPARDDKSLASWNALMIGALADAGATLAEPPWIQAAERALDTWQELAWRGGRLAHAIKAGEAYGTGFLDDYAGMACAAIDVYEATFEPRHLQFARDLCTQMIALFWDDNDAGFFYTPIDAEVVLQRGKEIYDHAYPGGAGLAADALLRAATLTGEPLFRTTAERMLGAVAGAARENPMGLATLVRAVDRAARGAVELVVLGDVAHSDTRAMLHAGRAVYVPHRAIACAASERDGQRQGLDVALIQGRAGGAGGAPVGYVCRTGVCNAPVNRPENFASAVRDAVAGR